MSDIEHDDRITGSRPRGAFRVRRRVLAILGGALMLSLLLLAAGVIGFVRQSEKTSWRDRQTEAAAHGAETVADFLSNTQTSMAVLGSVQPETVVREPQILRDLFKSMPFLIEVVWVDSRGRPLAGGARDEQLLDNLFTVRQSNWFISAAAGRPYLGDVQISPKGEPYVIESVAAPAGGVVAARLRLEVLRAVVRDVRFGKSGSAYVVNDEGRIVAHSDPSVVTVEHASADPRILQAVRTGAPQWIGSYTPPAGDAVLAATAPVPGTDWAIVTVLPQAEAFATSRTAIPFVLGLAALVGTIVLVGGTRSLSRSVLQPIERLRDSVERVGRGDFTQRLEIFHADELGEVADSFNRMAGSLMERDSQLAAQTEALVEEVAERERAQGELRHQALHDPLTGLPNRVLLVDRLAHALHRAERGRDRCAVLFMDMDGFKLVNDSFGHTVGDELLREIGRRLAATLRPEDTVARFGGDEFVVLVEDARSLRDAERVAQRIESALAEPFTLGGRDLFVTASIGVTLSEPDALPEDLLRDADIAMYRAKTGGKAAYVVFTESMRDRAVRRLETENDLRHALEREEFVVYYQPIVALPSRRIVACEALVRWHHPERGFVLPGEFIPVAEETGQIIAIDEWVLRRACLDACSWEGDGRGACVSVNLSRRHFAQPALPARVRQILAETDLEPRRLQLEITESLIMQDESAAVRLLAQLKAIGASIHVDDFGTGYSSLASLRSFPIDAVKIDRTFVSTMSAEGVGHGLVGAILSLADNLGIDAVVEGVETSEQLSALAAMGCRYIQGFHVGKPMPMSDLAELFGGGRGWTPRVIASA